MLVQTNTRCAPPVFRAYARPDGSVASKMGADATPSNSPAPVTQCPDDTNGTGAVAGKFCEKFFRRRGESKSLMGERPVTDKRQRRYTVLESLSRQLSASLRWGKQRAAAMEN
jgi:hypothetical protein